MFYQDGEFINALFTGDNLFVLQGINSNLVDLIYLDPPFNSKRVYEAPIGSKATGTSFKDIWTWKDVNEDYLETLAEKYPAIPQTITMAKQIHSNAMGAYLLFMAQRLIQMHRILKPTGSLYLHCDPTASHYIKMLLDNLFGKNNFRNEIIWCYRGGGVPRNDFARRHDVIFRYSKGDSPLFFVDDVRIPYSKESKDRLKYKAKSFRNGKVYDNYEQNELGKHPEDWWQVQPIMPSSKERTGYPTQKPLALLERIIQASSNKGDIVLDPFCGCATTCVAAQRLGRKWIGIDIEPNAARILIDRLSDTKDSQKGLKVDGDFVHRTRPPQRTDIEIEEPTKIGIKERLFADQNGYCNGCKVVFELRNFEVDHVIPKAKGGGDYYENYQLLCGSCNRIKGARPMEYLRMKIKIIQEQLSKKYTFGE